jgi:hypothetical protein
MAGLVPAIAFSCSVIPLRLPTVARRRNRRQSTTAASKGALKETSMEKVKRALLVLCSAAFAAVLATSSYLAVAYPFYFLWCVVVVPFCLIASLGMLRIAIRWKDRAKL